MPIRRVAQFVMKITKYCNLRCAYCYEYRDLGNKERMSLGALGRMFENIVADPAVHQYEALSFIWHGGEPFLVPMDYYEAISDLQRKFLADKIPYENVVQTNLTVLTDQHLEFLKSERFFTGLGVSFDVYGDQRIDKAGKLRTEVVLKNMQRLIDHGIPFGAICVLARNTLPHFREIYRFYDQLGIPSKFLPFYLSSFEEQITDHALTYDVLVDALKSTFDEWISSKRATSVDPIDEYLSYAVSYITEKRDTRYNKELDEYTFVVGLDGRVWGHGEAYLAGHEYGNLVHESFGAILHSKSRRRAIERTRLRLAEYCEKCPFFGACPGAFVADASAQQEKFLIESGCQVREVIDHIVNTFGRAGLSDTILAQVGQQQGNAAIAVNL